MEEKKKKEKKERASDINKKDADTLKYWTLIKGWPKEYFERDSQIREDLNEDSWLVEQMENSTEVVKYLETNGWRLPCPIRKASTSVRRKQSDSSLNGSSDQKSRDSKSAKYRNISYIILLERKGNYMNEFKLGVTGASLSRCRTLLDSTQTVPKDSLFRDDLFRATCDIVHDRNEARVIRSITPYIVLSVEDLETLGATDLEHLIEGVNECWTGNIAVEGSLPKSDYVVGFRRSAFIEEQLKKLDPLIGSVFDTSLFVATYRMYFSLSHLRGEVRCRGTGRRRSPERAQHDCCRKRCHRTLQSCETRERASPRDPRLFDFARSYFRENLWPLRRDRRGQGYLSSSPHS